MKDSQSETEQDRREAAFHAALQAEFKRGATVSRPVTIITKRISNAIEDTQ